MHSSPSRAPKSQLAVEQSSTGGHWNLNVSQPGDLTKGLGIHRESDLEAQWDLITRLP